MQIATTSPLRAPVKIAILALNGAVYSSIIGPMDVFSVANALRTAAGQHDFAQVRILRVGRQSPLSFNQLNIHTHGCIDTGDRVDVVILAAPPTRPGGLPEFGLRRCLFAGPHRPVGRAQGNNPLESCSSI
jgi:hypothetical protein